MNGWVIAGMQCDAGAHAAYWFGVIRWQCSDRSAWMEDDRRPGRSRVVCRAFSGQSLNGNSGC